MWDICMSLLCQTKLYAWVTPTWWTFYFIISIPMHIILCAEAVYVYRLTMLAVYNYLASDVAVVIMGKQNHRKLLWCMEAYAWAMPTP